MSEQVDDGAWLTAFIEAVEAIERDAICRIDVDILAESEVVTLKRFLGVLEDYADGYDEDRVPQARLSQVLRQRLLDESAQSLAAVDPVRANAVSGASPRADHARKG
jgi:hypothetical protein